MIRLRGEELLVDLDFEVDIKCYENFFSFSEIEKYVKEILEKEYFSEKEVYISILLTGNKQIQKINKEFRGKDLSTDVISFAYHDNEEFDIGIYDTLGDIIISLERVEEQSKEYGHSFEREFFYVLTHGILHLLGYDHMEEKDKKDMRKKEEEILSVYGYIRKK